MVDDATADSRRRHPGADRHGASGEDHGRPVTLAREESDRGSVALRRRRDDVHGEVYELIANGTFVMDTVETSTERLLARAAVDVAASRVDGPPALTVACGGLGLGYTVRELLDDTRVAAVEVVEIEPPILNWVRRGLVPPTAGVLADARVRTYVGDIRHWLPGRAAHSVDVLLLDVDNGPDFLVHLSNAEVYDAPFLTAARRVLRPGGVLAVWSAAPSPDLRRRLRDAFGSCDELRRSVVREQRDVDYFLYLAPS